MREASNYTLEEWNWRKSHQWLGLTRKHARAVVDDILIATVRLARSALLEGISYR